MGYPNGVSLAVISGGTAFTAFGDDVPVQITVTPRFPKQGGGFLTRIVHAATGWVMTSDPDTFTADAGTEVSFSVPHVDQAGFRDPAQNAYTGWYYEVKVVVGAARGRTKTAYTQTVSPVVGQALVDLDLVPEGQVGDPQSVAVPDVLSVNGMTGAVVIDAGGASDTDVAALVSDEGSATSDALASEFGPAALVGTAFDSFAGKADGPLVAGARADSRHRYTVRDNDPANAYKLVGGKLVHDLGIAGSPSAAYAGLEVPGRVGRVWAEFTHDAGGNASWEALTLIVSNKRPFTDPTSINGSTFEESAAHFVLNRTTWSYEVLLNPFQTVQIGAGTYTPVAVGTKQSVSLDFDGSTVTITLPDGTTRTVSDSRISTLRGPYATIESYAHTGSSLNPIGITAWGAAAEVPAQATTAVTRAALTTDLRKYTATAVRYYPGSPITKEAPTGATPEAIDAANVLASGYFGPTGRAIVRLSANFDFTNAGDSYLSLKANAGDASPIAGTVQPVSTVTGTRPSGITQMSWVISGGTAGAWFSYPVSFLTTVAGAITYKVGYPYGATIIEVQPV